MTSKDEKEKLKTKKKELERIAKEKELKEKGKEVLILKKEINNLRVGIDKHRERLWGKLAYLVDELQKKHGKHLEIQKRSLEQKKKPSESDKELKEKIEYIISFFKRFKKFFDHELKPGLRNFDSFLNLYFYTWGITDANNNFHELEKPFKIIIELNKSGFLNLGSEKDLVGKIKEDLGVLPKEMIKYYELMKEHHSKEKKYRRMSKKLSK